MKKEYKHIFEPFTVRRMTVKNRIMMTPMGTNYGEQSGEMSFLHINYYEQRAKGGTGLIMVENASVDSPEGSNGTTQLRIDHDNYIPRLFKFTETIHKHGTCVGIQLNHAGASAQSARTNMQPVSASNIPSKEGGEIPRPLEKDEILRIVKKYGSDILVKTLNLIQTVYGDDRTYYQGYVMEGFAKLLYTFEDSLKMNELIKRLKQKGFNDLLADINQIRPNFSSKKECLPVVVADIYNKRRRKSFQLDKRLLFI